MAFHYVIVFLVLLQAHSEAVSSPVITLIKESGLKAELQCESGGWYPEPELLWLDSEGDLLPAGPPETLRGPDDLYTVSSRVTVEKRSNSCRVTCRVQQKETNQIRETHFLISVTSWYMYVVLMPTFLVVMLTGVILIYDFIKDVIEKIRR